MRTQRPRVALQTLSSTISTFRLMLHYSYCLVKTIPFSFHARDGTVCSTHIRECILSIVHVSAVCYLQTTASTASLCSSRMENQIVIVQTDARKLTPSSISLQPISAQKCCNYFSTFKHFQSAAVAAALTSAVIIRDCVVQSIQ